mmetsp:Transcript_17128/g.20620  ORF Transcript_17128/g.20620 Transcript_17128/m.20620 type:complete len:315 (+) Transcript_17128:61-1005(+)
MPKQQKKKHSAGASPKIVRFKVSKNKSFEIMVNPGTVATFRQDRSSLSDVLLVETVFKNARKAVPATSDELFEAFGCTDVRKIAERILSKGDAQTSSSERKKGMEAKKRNIADFINKNYADARTGLPIPLNRILSVLEKQRVTADCDLVLEARRIVDEAKKKGELSVKRKETVMTLSLPAKFKREASVLFERRCSVLSRTVNGSQVVFELGYLAGELDSIIASAEKLTRGAVSLGSDGAAKRNSNEEKQDKSRNKAAKQTKRRSAVNRTKGRGGGGKGGDGVADIGAKTSSAKKDKKKKRGGSNRRVGGGKKSY